MGSTRTVCVDPHSERSDHSLGAVELEDTVRRRGDRERVAVGDGEARSRELAPGHQLVAPVLSGSLRLRHQERRKYVVRTGGSA